jgi:hypothetical protein
MKIYTRGPWVSPDGQTMNQTDLILTDRRQTTNIAIVRIYLLTPWSRVLLEKLTSKLCS